MIKKLIIVTGCSGGGKSALLSNLSSQGYTVIPEAGRKIVKEQLEIAGDALPWQNQKRFCELVIQSSLENYQHAKLMPQQIIFFDRCFLDNVSYYQTLNIPECHKYDSLIDSFRFYSHVFMAPPWKEIFIHDEERKHSFEDAVTEFNRLVDFYHRSRYQIIELPKTSIEERTLFLLSAIS